MDPKLVRAANEIPEKLKAVMLSMFEQSQPALRSGVSALRESLKKLENYLGEVEREHLTKANTTGPTTVAKAGTKTKTKTKATKQRRRGKNFMIGEFLLARLAENPRGLRPVDLAKLVAEAVPGQHKSPQAITSTTLARLKSLKKVVNKSGVWSVAKS